MIVDVNTQVWNKPRAMGEAAHRQLVRDREAPWERPQADGGAHLEAMAVVDAAIIHGCRCPEAGAVIEHEDVARFLTRAQGKFIGFAGIHPLEGNVTRQIEEAKQHGLVGVTISPAGQMCHPSHTRAMALYEQCQAMGWPVFVQAGRLFGKTAKLEFDQPHLWDEVARAFPDLRLVLAQGGYPWIEPALELLAAHAHVYVELSMLVEDPWLLYKALYTAHARHVTHKILLGSGFPNVLPEEAIFSIYSVNSFCQRTRFPTIPRRELSEIVERDALACLGIEAPPNAKSNGQTRRVIESDEATMKIGEDI